MVTSVVDAVGSDIRRRIFSGELAPGAALTEIVVSADYEVSRPTAKAAIEKVAGEGLLERGAHKTARVPVLTPDDVRDIYRTRLRLESEAVRELAADRRVPASAVAANDRVRASGTASSIASVEPDMRFHAALIDQLESPRLGRMYGSLVNEVRLCMAQVQGRSLLPVDQIADEHQEILKAIGDGDGDTAVSILTGHLGRASERLAAAVGH
jgi:DNA-binding GntR family transcriptional regulator